MILSCLLHAFYATAMAYLLAHIFGFLQIWIVVLALILGWLVGAQHARHLLKTRPGWCFSRFSFGQAGLIECALFAFVLYASWRHFTWMLFPIEHQLATLSATNLGDLPLHLNFIRAFANGIEFPPQNPIFASELLRYPYGADLYNALWETLGVHLEGHLFIVGIMGVLASLILLRSFAGWWGVGAFFLNGGIAGWEILAGTPANLQSVAAWKNFFIAIFITQRGMLFALPIGILLLILMRGHFSGEKPLDRKSQRIVGILWGFLPLFHLHAFFIVSLMIGAISLEQSRRGVFRALTSFLGLRAFWLALFPAAYLIWNSTRSFAAASVMHWSWGWTKRGNEALLGYLFTNFGPWLLVPFVILALLVWNRNTLPKDERRRLWIEFSAYMALWGLFFNLMMAPWSWDNIKLLIWPYLGFSRLLYVLLEPKLGRVLGAFERPLLASIFFLSGAVLVLSTLGSPKQGAVVIYSVEQLAKTAGALAEVSPRAVFAAASTYNHPLSYYGRLRAAGYDGHLWSHGINGKAVYLKLEKLMKGENEVAQLAREMGITHIFWGPDEVRAYKASRPPWADQFKNVSRVPGYAVFEVK